MNGYSAVMTMNKRRPKSNRNPDETGALDMCQTPPYALTPLLPFIPKNAIVWESADGEGYMSNALGRAGLFTISTDIIFKQDFFTEQPPFYTHQVTNPPYSKKYKWIKQSYELGRPFALLVPTETISRADVQVLMQKYGYEVMLLDRRIDFKMPSKGWDSHSQFPVIWYCWRMLPKCVNFGHVDRAEVEAWNVKMGVPKGRRRKAQQ